MEKNVFSKSSRKVDISANLKMSAFSAKYILHVDVIAGTSVGLLLLNIQHLVSEFYQLSAPVLRLTFCLLLSLLLPPYRQGSLTDEILGILSGSGLCRLPHVEDHHA